MRIFLSAPNFPHAEGKTRLTIIDCVTSGDLLHRISEYYGVEQKLIIASLKWEPKNVSLV